MGIFVLENNGMPVSGEVEISGAKNSALPLLAAAVMCKKSVIENCPHLSDTFAAIEILQKLGFFAELKNNTALIETSDTPCFEVSAELCRKMRSSILFLAPVMIRCGQAELCVPGGCCLGKRPIDMHLDVLKSFGAKVIFENEKIYAKAENGLTGTDIHLDIPSVGATETAVMAAAAASGHSRIFSPAIEPEIEDLCRFLNASGADISFGTVIEINGKNGLLGDAKYRVMPDRIEAGTYLAAAAITGGELFLKNISGQWLESVCEVLYGMGCVIKCGENDIYIEAPEKLYLPSQLETGPYPMFPTDMQPQFTALFSAKSGECLINETIFENRCGHISQLRKMGADIMVIDRRQFIVSGHGTPLHSAVTKASDLRCGAALVLAALTAKDGVSVIKDGGHILRGYENLCEKMSNIGVKMLYKP